VFTSESFIDEIAAAVGTDPVAFRLRYLKAPRDIAVVKAAAGAPGGSRTRRQTPTAMATR
jgi:nicotinate dehydrogenase subunit B